MVPKTAVKKRKWLPHPAFSGAKKRAEMLRQPCILRVSPTPMAGANKKRFPKQGNKIGSGCLSPAFSGAQTRAEMLPHPGILGSPHKRGGKSEVFPNKGGNKKTFPPHPCLLGGPKRGGNGTSPLHSWGSPAPSAGRKIRSVPQQRGKQAKVGASTLPSRGPKRGQKCYLTPAFSGVPNAKRGEENRKC